MKEGVRHILISGLPGCGKTTLVQNVARRLKEAGVPLFGFWTEEVRQRGRRLGFAIELVGGARGTLAREGLREGPKVSRYRVDVKAFEALVLPELQRALDCAAPAVLMIDEIGKMELFSGEFERLVTTVLDSQLTVVATIMSRPNPFADAVKARADVKEITLTRTNRECVLACILGILLRKESRPERRT